MKQDFGKFVSVILLSISSQLSPFTPSSIDLSLIGRAKYNTGLGGIGIGIIDILKNDIKINHFALSDPSQYGGIPKDVVEILQNTDTTPGNVALLYWPVYTQDEYAVANSVKSHIRIAFSMLESTKIPEKWVQNFNQNFDAVILPDEWLKEVYLSCGVTVPLFVLPHGICLENFLNESIRDTPATPFRFGSSAVFTDRKNQHLLIDAFQAEFAGDTSVELVIHGGKGSIDYFKAAKKKIEECPVPSISIIANNTLSRKQYLEFMKSIDCYVLVSKGEGFSITPREALALGIPTIVSNNTAHKTICDSGYVSGVPSEILHKALYPRVLGLGDCGHDFNCTIEDVRKELRKVHSNFAKHKEIATKGREWARGYLWANLKKRFLTLVKPKKVIYGTENVIGEDFLMTDSKELYNKYCDFTSIK